MTKCLFGRLTMQNAFAIIATSCLLSLASAASGENATEPREKSRSQLSYSAPPQLLVQLGHSTRDIKSVALSPDGLYVLTGSDDGTVLLWDKKTAVEVEYVLHRVVHYGHQWYHGAECHDQNDGQHAKPGAIVVWPKRTHLHLLFSARRK